MRSFQITTFVLVCVLAAVVVLATPGATHAQMGGVNLLVDGDFEAPPTWPQQDGIGEVQVAPGWRAWYLDNPPSYVQIPVNCNGSREGTRCYWMRPEFRDNTSFENRIHSGVRSQKYFSYGRMHEAGLYQQVGGIKPGSSLRFAIAIQSWQCFNIDKCGKNGIRSDAPAEMHLRVGIDPTGGTNPFSPDIVWSPEQAAFDRWVEFSVEAQAKGDTVTVFTHSRPDWSWARNNNDVYLDDASLVVVSATPAQVQPVAPKNVAATDARSQLLGQLKKYRSLKWHPDCDSPSCFDVDIWGDSGILTPAKPTVVSTPASAASTSVTLTVAAPVTSTVSSPGAPRTYVVVEGDTLTLIAKRFNTTMAALMQANQITNPDIVWIGRTLIIP